jgi:hypothetical protein
MGEDSEKFDVYLKSVGLPQEKHSSDFQQDALPAREHDTWGRRTRPTKDVLGESRNHQSFTQQGDELDSLHEESAANESITLSPEWLRYLEYMDVIAEALSPADTGAALKERALRQARSRFWEQPPDLLRPMNASLGKPAEFRERWFYGELEIRTHVRNRRERNIEIWRLPPQEPEDLDEAGQPAGHWEGLKWIPDTPKKSDS